MASVHSQLAKVHRMSSYPELHEHDPTLQDRIANCTPMAIRQYWEVEQGGSIDSAMLAMIYNAYSEAYDRGDYLETCKGVMADPLDIASLSKREMMLIVGELLYNKNISHDEADAQLMVIGKLRAVFARDVVQDRLKKLYYLEVRL